MPGAVDANGVYIYAEDDLLSPFSAFMNKGQQAASALAARAARGIMPNGYAAISADAGTVSSTTPIDVPGLSATVTTYANRMYRISADLNIQATVAGDRAGIFLKDGATTIVGGGVYVSNSNVGNRAFISRIYAPSAGVHTFGVLIARNSGTGNVAVDGGGGNPCYLLVEDIGSSV